jgi:putative ABC transport system ATP-binding protein
LLGGVALPQQGTIRLLGTELTQLSNPQRNRFRADHIGFIFQQFNLIPWLSAVDNALLSGTFSTLRRQRAGDMKKQAMLVDVNYPDRSATTILAGGSGE